MKLQFPLRIFQSAPYCQRIMLSISTQKGKRYCDSKDLILKLQGNFKFSNGQFRLPKQKPIKAHKLDLCKQRILLFSLYYCIY